MIRAGIIGGAGYTGGEVLRILLNHPDVTIVFVQSESQQGKPVTDVHRDCFGLTDLIFEKEINAEADVVFLCKGHGESRKYLESKNFSAHVRIIDLSQDFRHSQNSRIGEREFIYGLPELHRDKITEARSVANPGCFATCIQLALLPLAAAQQINSDVYVTATTGSTGAGQSYSDSTHFSWRSNNHGAYKLLNHQHETEIRESISRLQPFTHELNFVPQRGAFTRGIYSVTYVNGKYDLGETRRLYGEYYNGHPFTHVVPFDVDVKQVVNTNNCFVSLHKERDKLIVVTAIDNLLKGAAGQAVQNMNLLFGMNETRGLRLKPAAF
jgi:N-acetyl-gamma-glutamyl-phosphate reductase